MREAQRRRPGEQDKEMRVREGRERGPVRDRNERREEKETKGVLARRKLSVNDFFGEPSH